MKKIAIVNTKSPFNDIQGRESLDACLALASYEQDVTLFFLGAGVLQLVQGQTPEQIQSKDYLATIKALPFYDVEQLYVCQQSLNTFGYGHADILSDAELKTPEQIAELLNQFDVVLSF